MTIVEQAKIIQEKLQEWAKDQGGKAFVASDLMHMWESAFKTSQSPRVIVCYNGETIRGGDQYAAAMGRVDRYWLVAVMRGRGFNADRGDSLIETVGNTRPFYDLVEEARDIIRVMSQITLEDPVNFKEVRPMQRPDELIDGYLIEFSTANFIGGISPVPANVEPE